MRPTIPDPERWGPWLRSRWLAGDTVAFADEAAAARQVLIGAPCGTYSRVMAWAITGPDPGQPECTCCPSVVGSA